MAKWEASTTIDRPVEDVWKFVTDLSNMPKWNPEVLEPKQTSAGPLGVGTTVEFGAKMGNTTWTILMRTFETIEGKTRFTHRCDLKYSGIYKLVGPFVTPGMRRGVVASLAKLKRILESEAQS